MQDHYFQYYQIEIMVFQRILSNPINNDNVVGNTGLLQLCKRIRNILNHNLLGLWYVRNVFPSDESGTETVSNEEGTPSALKRVLTFTYTLHRNTDWG